MDAVVVIDGVADAIYRGVPTSGIQAHGNAIVVEADPDTVFAGFLWDANAGYFTAPAMAPTSPSSYDINAERDRRVAAGTTVTVTGYGDIPLQGGERDQTNLLGLVTAAQVRLAGGDNATLTKFRDADNVDHMLAPAQIIEMWSKGAAWISANYDASWVLKAMDPIPADFANDSYWP